jgi:crossover junction endodeoxyribonuclease RuvC
LSFHEDCARSTLDLVLFANCRRAALQGTNVFKRMFVLGIDPGLSRCGFGLVQAGKGDRHISVEHGVLQTAHTDPIHIRLASMMAQLEELYSRLQPNVVVVERVFFQTNVRTAMGVGQASGLALALATRQGCQVHQYTSNEVKQAVAGYGSAEKYQMQEMVARLLNLAAPPKPADAADALGLALCHIAHARLSVAAVGAASVGRPIADPGGGVFGGRPLKIAKSIGGIALAPSTAPNPKQKNSRAEKSA